LLWISYLTLVVDGCSQVPEPAVVAQELARIAAEDVSTSEQSQRLKALAERLDDRALKLLGEVADTHAGSETGWLAVRAIATVGDTAAVETLKGLMKADNRVAPPLVVFALAEIPDAGSIEELRRLALTQVPVSPRLAAIAAMRWRGELSDARAMREVAERAADTRVATQLHLAADAIVHRLTRLPETVSVEQWAGYQRSFWPAVMQPPPHRGLHVALRAAAVGLQRNGGLPALFLQRIADTEAPDSQAVAVQLMGLQGLAGEVWRCYELAQRPGLLGRAGLNALIDIGNETAVDHVGTLLSQADYPWTSIAAEGLVKIGTPRAADALERAAAAMEDRDPALADYFKARAGRIRTAAGDTNDTS
jgi:HEAT repeat protein